MEFSIQKIMERFVPDVEKLSKELFPLVKYPKQAFDRVLKGEAYLDSMQIEKLAKYLGVLVADLFTCEDWQGSYDNSFKCLVFIKGPYRVNLNYGGAFITVYKDGNMIHQVVKSTTDMSLEAFIQYINTLINNKNGSIKN